MAMFPTARLFYVLLVAFVAKHADGMRGASDPICMLWCECPEDRSKTTKELYSWVILLRPLRQHQEQLLVLPPEASKGCRCVTAEHEEGLSNAA